MSKLYQVVSCSGWPATITALIVAPPPMHHVVIRSAAAQLPVICKALARVITSFLGFQHENGRVAAQKLCSAHLFSSMIYCSSSGVKSFSMLKNLRISWIDLFLINEATLAQASSSKGLMSRKLEAMINSKSTSYSKLM